MANFASIIGDVKGNGNVLMFISVLLTGNYADPEVIDLSAVADPGGNVPEGFFENPSFGGVFSARINGYQAELVPGTALNNWNLVIYSAPNTKLAAGAYNGGGVGIVAPENQVILAIPRRNM